MTIISREELQEQIAEELAKFEDTEQEENIDVKVKSESSVDEDSSELISEDSQASSTTETEETSKPTLTVEDEARESGWTSKQEWVESGKDPKAWKTADQYVKDGSFFKKIDAQKKEIQELKNLMKQQIEHNKKVEKAAYEKALKEVQQEKLQKVSEGDTEGFRLAEQKEEALKEQFTQPTETQQAPELTDEVKSFVDRNKSWFNMNTEENAEMARAADLIDKFIDEQAKQKGKTLTQTEQLSMVEERIKKLYPHRFENPNLKKPSTVAKSTSGYSGDNKGITAKLTKRQLDYVKQAQRHGLNISVEEYAKQLKLTGDLRDE